MCACIWLCRYNTLFILHTMYKDKTNFMLFLCTLSNYLQFVVNNPPTLNPDGGDDRTVYVTEGSNVALTCTRDTNNAPGDLYQWIHPNGQMTPRVPGDSPVQVTLNNITRNGNGVYICQGSRNGVTDSVLQSNVTLIVQRELYLLSNVLKTYMYNLKTLFKISINDTIIKNNTKEHS